MFVNNLRDIARIKLLNNVKFIITRYNCPIKINFLNDSPNKYQSHSYSILNKMEDNFETKLKNIGK